MRAGALIYFYLGSHADSRGRMLAEILQQDDLWLETCHDYIQWLFPNRQPSRVTPDAPLITREIEQAFRADVLLRDQLRASFERLLAFYGLQRSADGIEKAPNWQQRKVNWFTQDTHNNLRITRILKCLMALGLEADARMFFEALERLRQSEPDCGIGSVAFDFWYQAVDR